MQMRKWLLLSGTLCFLISCKKEERATVEFSEASYKLTITGLWASPQFTLPSGAHFTALTGMVHENEAALWQEGSLASPGLEAVAEIGSQYPLLNEVDSFIALKKAISQINIPAPAYNGSIARTLYFNNHYSSFSFASMVAPSPDWFVGAKDIHLYRNGAWLADTTLQLRVYDAGTEEGDVFSLNNPATVPQQTVQLLTPAKATVLTNGNAILFPIAQVRITKQ